MPRELYPECDIEGCDSRSFGAVFEEFEGGVRARWRAKFLCRRHGPIHFAVHSETLFPQWRLLSRLGKGMFVMEKVPETRRAQRLDAR